MIKLYKCDYRGYEDVILLGKKRSKNNSVGVVVGRVENSDVYPIGYYGEWGCNFEEIPCEESVTIRSKNKLFVNNHMGKVLIKTRDKYGRSNDPYYTMISKDEVKKISMSDISINKGMVFVHQKELGLNGTQQYMVTEFKKIEYVKFKNKKIEYIKFKNK